MQETQVRSPGGGSGDPFQCSGLENPVDRGTCPPGVSELGVTEQLSIGTPAQLGGKEWGSRSSWGLCPCFPGPEDSGLSPE